MIGLNQHLPALIINNLALHIHHIVIFQQLLTDIVVSRFHFSLSIFHCPGKQTVLNRLIFFQTQPLHHPPGDAFPPAK